MTFLNVPVPKLSNEARVTRRKAWAKPKRLIEQAKPGACIKLTGEAAQRAVANSQHRA